MEQGSGAVSVTPAPAVTGALALEILVMAVGPLLNHMLGEFKHRAKVPRSPAVIRFLIGFSRDSPLGFRNMNKDDIRKGNQWCRKVGEIA